MDFNWGSGNAPVVFSSSGELTNISDVGLGTSYTTLPFDEMNYPLVGGNPLSANFGYSAGVFTAQEDGQVYTFNYDMQFNRSILSDTLFVQWLVNGIPVNVATSTSTFFTYSGNFTTPPLTAGDTVLCQAYSTLGTYELDGVFDPLGTTPSLVTITTSVSQTTNETLLETLRGELGQWDFLKGLMTMFNLVSMIDENNPNNILIEPYDKVFIDNPNIKQLDWTDKIDVSEMSLEPLTDLNKSTIFKFVEDEDDFNFMQYKRSTGGHLYGSKVLDASIVMGLGIALPTILEGEKEIIAEPFAATISRQLMSQYPDFIVPSLYAMESDNEPEGFDNSPRIFYDNGIKTLAAHTYSVPAQNGSAAVPFQADFLQFSHFSDIPISSPSTQDWVFESAQLFTGLGSPPVNNLYTEYWAGYFNELYNADTRVISLMVSLTPSDIATFNFYDKIFIRNRIFRVNKIQYKPNSLAQVEFILIP